MRLVSLCAWYIRLTLAPESPMTMMGVSSSRNQLMSVVSGSTLTPSTTTLRPLLKIVAY